MGKQCDLGIGSCSYQICFSVVKTVSYARLFLYTLWKTFLSFTRVQRETRDPGEDFRKMIISEFYHKLYPGSEARGLGENKFKLIKTLKGHTGHQTALSKLHLQINLKTCIKWKTFDEIKFIKIDSNRVRKHFFVLFCCRSEWLAGS